MNGFLLAAFITGLTAGGLSCLAVQGGLVTGSLANYYEMDLALAGKAGRISELNKSFRLAYPILVFLVAKLVAHTLLGFGLGGLGTIISLTSITRGILQFAIGLFMIGNSLRMLNVHPVFRFFTFEPPSPVRRFIRRISKQKNAGAGVLTPIFLGFLTVLIPCGITQSMMALAVATSNPLSGASLMFAYVLGTGPVFFLVTFIATRLSALLEKQFTRIVAAALLILGIYTVDTGLNLVGSPVSITRTYQQFVQEGLSPTPAPALTPTSETAAADEIVIKVLNGGYSPSNLTAPANKSLKLKLVTSNVTSCALSISIPPLKFTKTLKGTGTEIVDIPPQEPGTIFRYSCTMGMYTGRIVFK